MTCQTCKVLKLELIDQHTRIKLLEKELKNKMEELVRVRQGRW